MGAHWKTEARKAGYDPRRVVDVPPSFGKMVLTIDLKDMKGAVIGDATNCSGARCIRRKLDADWAYVGPSSGIIVPKGSRRLLRFLVNGLAKKQDRTMNVVGEKLILRAPAKSNRLGAKAKRVKDVPVRSHKRARPGEGDTKPQATTRTRSIAAMLRSD